MSVFGARGRSLGPVEFPRARCAAATLAARALRLSTCSGAAGVVSTCSSGSVGMASRLPKAGLVTVVGHGTPCCTPFATRPDVSRSGAPPDRQLGDRACDCGELVVPNAIAWNVQLEDDPEWSVEFAHVAADIFIQVARRGCSGQKRVAGRDSHVHPIDAKGSPVPTAAVLGRQIPAVV